MTVDEVERLRKKAANKILVTILVVSIITLVLTLATIPSGSFIVVVMLGLVVGAILTSLISAKSRKEFKLAFKECFVLKSLNEIFSDVDYKPEQGLAEHVISSTGMMDMGDRYSSNDYVSAKYKNVKLVQADVHIEEERESRDKDGNIQTYYVTLFKGRWMVFDFNKTFKANLQVRQKGFANATLKRAKKEVKYKKITLEDQVFNNEFKVYAQSEHEAFYLLTPSLMEKIRRVTNNVGAKILFCFVDNKLHVGIDNRKDSFEHGIFTPIDEKAILNNISKDIKLITEFVEELDLDNELFRKGV